MPVNYRLEDDQLNALIDRQEGPLVLADAATAPRVVRQDVAVFGDWLAALPAEVDPSETPFDDDAVAVVLYTSERRRRNRRRRCCDIAT